MFAQPEWFLVLPVLALLGWQARWLCLWLPLRAMTLIMLTLVLVDVRLRTHEDGLDLWVLVDRSASAGDVIEPRLAEWEGLIRAGQGSEDQLHFVDFAAAATERTAQVERFEAQRNRTHLSSALELALNRRDESKLARVLVLTDGYPTDPLSQVKQAYREAGIPVDYRTAAFAADLDFAVEALSVPPQVQAGEPFLIEGVVSGPPQGQAEYQLLRNGEPIGQGTLGMDDGRAWLRLSARAEESGAFEYRLVIRSESDPRPGNNAFARWIEVTGGPRIVLLSRYDNDPLAGLLQQTGMRVEVLNEPRRFHEGMLNGAELIVLNDVPANEFPEGGLEAIDFFVRAQGGAMLMLGGKFSFGSGGYFESPLEEVLPVSLELKDEHRRLAIAMAIVMDRSGSMAASTGGGQTKMELANSGAAETTRLLGAEDLIAVYAVDSAAHEMVGLTTVVSNRGEIERRIRSIGSMGGGIYVFNGLQAAWNTLKTAPKGQRHVILFADAADAEQPGSYRSLIAEMRNSATTVSVIGLGTRSDPDANFLEDIAKRGGGRAFFSADASELPSIFAQETVAVARSTFVEETTPVEPTAGWLELASRPLEWMAAVDGYNLTYAKEGATLAAFTRDEYQAPLVAFWNKGAGRAAAVTFPLAGPFSNRVRVWPSAGDFVQTLTRWLAGTSTPDGLALRTRQNGSELSVEVYFDDTWADELARSVPEILYTTGGMETMQQVTWARVEPGRLRAVIDLPPDKPVRGAVRLGGEALSFGPIVAGANLEWQARPAARASLAALSRATGGVERLNLATAWESPPAQRRQSIRWWLLIAALICFVADVANSRLGLWQWGRRAH